MLGRVGFWRGLLGQWPASDKAQVMAALQRVGVAGLRRPEGLDPVGRPAAARRHRPRPGAEGRGPAGRRAVASLDPVSARRVMELLSDLNREDGLAVVVTLHQVDYALRYCPRIVALKAGKVVYDGPSVGLDRAALVDIYGPEIQEVFWEGEQR
ncbi:MAG: hypothetical protein WDN45_11615 [Caulobacteraceae bacterium]